MKRTINTLEDREKALKIIADLYFEAATWENAVEYFDSFKDESVLERLKEHMEKTPGRFTWKEQLIIDRFLGYGDPHVPDQEERTFHAFTEGFKAGAAFAQSEQKEAE